MPNLFIRDCYDDQFAHFAVSSLYSYGLLFRLLEEMPLQILYMILSSSDTLNMMSSVYCTIKVEKWHWFRVSV